MMHLVPGSARHATTRRPHIVLMFVCPSTTATNTPGQPIHVGSAPGLIAITPDGKTAYVASAYAVTPISTATNRPGKPIYIRSDITIAITPDGKTVYAATSGKVIPISTATNTASKPIQVGPGAPGGIAITP